MEWIVQLLDDVDDAVSTVLLLREKIRNAIIKLLFALGFIAAQAGGIVLALAHPPLALATAMLLFVALLYRSVTGVHQPLEIA